MRKSNIASQRRRSLGLRATVLAGVAAATGLLLLHMATQMDAAASRPAPAERLELWTAEALDGAGQVQSTVQICTDAVLRDGFTRALPRINAEQCLVVGQPTVRDDLFAARCVAGGQKFSVNVTKRGNVGAGEITARVRIRPLYVDHPGVLQVLRYRRAGACPPDSRVGASLNRATGKTYDALDTRGG
jgi:hypothetical protein